MNTDRDKQINENTNKTQKLVRYMKVRSKVEECKWSLDNDYLEPSFINGVRNFFGVQLDNSGNLLFDEQEPQNGYLELWKDVDEGRIKHIYIDDVGMELG